MESTLRDVQLCELQMLKDIKKVCEKRGIKFYLSGGTLLGAVRHQGFIPWDDDVDLMMPLEDYLRFLKNAQEDLGDGYFIQNSDTDPTYAFAYTHVRKNSTAMLRDWEFQVHSHHGVWVDVSPLVFIDSKKERSFKNTILKICFMLIMDEEQFSFSQKWYTEKSNAVTVSAIKFARKLPKRLRDTIRKQLLDLIYYKPKGKFTSFVWTRISVPIPSDAYEGKPVYLKFEDEEFPVPKGYKQFLELSYGDYMAPPPVEKRNGGHGEYAVIDLNKDWTYYCN